jgi:hypothetical protein
VHYEEGNGILQTGKHGRKASIFTEDSQTLLRTTPVMH